MVETTLQTQPNRCCVLNIPYSSGYLSFCCPGCGTLYVRRRVGDAWVHTDSRIIPVRPSKLFGLVDQCGPERVAHIRIPKRRDPNTPDYSLKLLETMVLIAVMKLTGTRNVFEFGTFLGNTATNLALNGEPGTVIYTLDLLPETEVAAPRAEDHPAIDFRMSHLNLEWEAFPHLQDRIVPIFGDSTKLDFSPYSQTMDLVWLDGGRDAATVVSDARNAFRMLRNDKLAVIGWHDYQHPDTAELNAFLEDLASHKTLYHVQDTAMVLHFNRPVDFS